MSLRRSARVFTILGLLLVLAGCVTFSEPTRKNLDGSYDLSNRIARHGRAAFSTYKNVDRNDAEAGTKSSDAKSMGTSKPADGMQAELGLDPAVTYGKLDNGLTYYLRENHKPENRVELRLMVNAGSMQEDDDQRGLAHFVEHMAFNGTKNFEKQEIIDFLEKIGMRFGPDINAFTSFDETVYMLQLPADDPEILNKGFMILREWASNVEFEDEEIDKERGVVLEEWRLGRGAGARIRDKQFPTIFKGSRYAERLVIGDPEILQHAPYDRLRAFYRDWYRPDLMAVVAVGDIDKSELDALLRKHFSSLEGPEKTRARVEYPVPDHEETLFAIATDPEQTNSSVALYTKLDKQETHTVADYRKSLVQNIYHGLLNNRLDEIRQKADPPFRFAFSDTGSFVRTKDILFQMAGVKEGESERGLEALLTEVKRVDEHGFTSSELERMKVNLLRGYEQAYRERDKQQSSGYTWEYMSHFLEGEPAPGIEEEYRLAQNLIPSITVDEVNAAASEWITEGNRVFVFSGPEKEDAPPPTQQALLGVERRALSKQVDPYEDRVKDQPLVAKRPSPARIVNEKSIDEIGVTEWELSNGVRIVMKPTDFRNDEIRMSGFSPGGHSLVPDEDHTSAIYATSVLSVGGLGEFDAVELEKALAGKVASAWTSISELEEGVGGNASPQDLETMLQLTYLRFTAPRVDREAIESWMVRVKEGIQNRRSRPETVFGDTWSETVSKGHHRRRPSSLEKLEEIDVDKAYEIYKDRFADASDFTFILVGNFEPEKIKPQLLTWLGGLPSLNRNESWRNVGVHEPDGVVGFDVRKGMEPKSSTRILFHGDTEWTREEQFLMGALGSALQIRLREILREEMGGTYGVGVGGSLSRRPEQEYSFSVRFGSSPENVEPMIDAVFAELDRFKKEGVEQDYIDKVKEGRVRSREVNLKENRFWLNVLENYYTFGDDPRDIMKYDELVDLITSERLRAMARKYLSTDQYVYGMLFPENWDGEGAKAMAAGGRGAE